MCGIAGVVGLRDGEIAATMVRRIAHRGPDDEGTWLSPSDQFPVMFGSRRLAILDLSAAGHMPMLSKDGRFVITYNGEIFNYRELREELKRAGHRFTRVGIPKSSSRAISNGGRPVYLVSMGCSPSRFGTARSGASFSPATEWG
jgi:Asparagine synthase (glutamine-hydrolyzing)